MFDFGKIERLKSKADGGDLKAQIELGKEYLKGQNIQASFTKAYAYFSMAARKNDPEALFLLAECNDNGTGTEVNPSNAYMNYQKSANFGYLRAVIAFANFCETGRSGVVDFPKALQYYQMAVKLGHGPAKEQVTRLEKLVLNSQSHQSQNESNSGIGTRGTSPAHKMMAENAQKSAPESIKIDDVPFFRGLGAMELLFMMGLTQNIKGKRGDFLFCEGQAPNGLFVVLSGKCSVRLTNLNSNSFTEIKNVLPGDYVGEFGLIDGLPRSATVVVTENAELMFLPTAAFVSTIQNQPKVAEVVKQNLLTTIRDKNIMIRDKESRDLVYSGRPVPNDLETLKRLTSILRASNSTEQTDYWDR